VKLKGTFNVVDVAAIAGTAAIEVAAIAAEANTRALNLNFIGVSSCLHDTQYESAKIKSSSSRPEIVKLSARVLFSCVAVVRSRKPSRKIAHAQGITCAQSRRCIRIVFS
jgi:hypothetical protein